MGEFDYAAPCAALFWLIANVTENAYCHISQYRPAGGSAAGLAETFGIPRRRRPADNGNEGGQ